MAIALPILPSASLDFPAAATTALSIIVTILGLGPFAATIQGDMECLLRKIVHHS